MTCAGFESSYATKLFGLQTGVANALLNVPLVFSVAISTAMLPNLSFLIAKKCDVAFSIKRGLRILLFLILPACFGILAISKEVLKVVYSNLSMSDIEICFNLL
ncbi:MAG: hypothetical protein MJ152_03500, partial [Clostridia bacterium]|nr:hypothetical protein [Clostridia bacterium]